VHNIQIFIICCVEKIAGFIVCEIPITNTVVEAIALSGNRFFISPIKIFCNPQKNWFGVLLEKVRPIFTAQLMLDLND